MNLPQPLIQLICVVLAPQLIRLLYDVLNRIVILSLTTLVRVKHFLSTLLRGREEQHHFALAERF